MLDSTFDPAEEILTCARKLAEVRKSLPGSGSTKCLNTFSRQVLKSQIAILENVHATLNDLSNLMYEAKESKTLYCKVEGNTVCLTSEEPKRR